MAYEKKISDNASTFCCNALMFRTLQALEESKYDIPYIYLHLPCTVRAVSGIQNFDESKYLALVSRTQEMLVIISGYYRQ